MALVKCPECGKENVSDSAVSCPECGYAIKEHFDKIRLEEQRAKEERRHREEKEAEAQRLRETEPERQEETIKRLKNQIKKSTKGAILKGVCFAVSLALLVLSWQTSEHGSAGMTIVIFFFATILFGILFIVDLNDSSNAKENLEKAKRSIVEYERARDEQIAAWVAYNKASAAKAALKHPKCPVCGSTNTERISTLNRATSVAAVGLASSKIGKQYRCKKCKHMW